MEWVSGLVVVLASWLLGAGMAVAEPQEWDQQEATKLAQEFVETIDKIIAGAKTAPLQKTAIRQRTRDGAVSGLSAVRKSAEAYAKQLESGRDGSATELFFAQVREGFEQTRSVARDAVASGEQRSNLETAEKLLDQLARYYDY